MIDSANMEIINGGFFCDDRGKIRFVNDFDMSSVKRFYILENSDDTILRGWRGHQSERRWFFPLKGEFRVDVVFVDNWELPNRNQEVFTYRLSESENHVLHIPEGCATLIQALTRINELLIFADFGIEHAKQDDFQYDVQHFINRNN